LSQNIVYLYNKQLLGIFTMKFTVTYEQPLTQLSFKDVGEEFL